MTGLADSPQSVHVTESELVFHGKVWDVRSDVFDYNGSSLRRDYVDHTGAVAIIALDERDRVLLVKQYRHPVRMREWEPPAGLLDQAGEDPLEAAKRELGEEADVRAEEWHVLHDYVTSPGGNNEVIRIYLARQLSAADDDFEREGEEADMEVEWHAVDDVLDAVLASRVQNPSLVIGMLALDAARRRDWSTLRPADAPWPALQDRRA